MNAPAVECEWCGEKVPNDAALAVKPKAHAVMMCRHCAPSNPDVEA